MSQHSHYCSAPLMGEAVQKTLQRLTKLTISQEKTRENKRPLKVGFGLRKNAVKPRVRVVTPKRHFFVENQPLPCLKRRWIYHRRKWDQTESHQRKPPWHHREHRGASHNLLLPQTSLCKTHNIPRTLFGKLRSRSLKELTRQTRSTSNNGHAPPPVESKK